MHMLIIGSAWMPDENGLSNKIPVAESGNFERMQATIAYYAANSIRCEFTVTITE